jgi:murein DD-endopeptidase
MTMIFPRTQFLVGSIVLLSSFILFSCGTTEMRTSPSFQGKPNMRYSPAEYQIPQPQRIYYEDEMLSAVIFSRTFSQGDAAYIEIIPKSSVINISLSFTESHIPITRKSWGYRGLFAIPSNLKPGDYRCFISFSDYRGKHDSEIVLKISDTHFKIFRKALDLGLFSDESKDFSPETIAFIKECAKKKETAFSEIVPDLITSSLSHPRDAHYITSDCFSQRVYMKYKYIYGKRINLNETNRIHYGLDLRGAAGSPVFAMMAGKISLSSEMYYEGNIIIINHGEGIFTYYMHMSKLFAREGSFVGPGEIIGEVGSTGVSTGPHLHVSLIIHGFMADPLSLLCLPIRD